MFHCHKTIYRFIHNSAKYTSVNLHKDNHLHHMFFDQMKIASKLELSPEIKMMFNYPPNIKKVIFDKVNYYDLIHPPFELNPNDKKIILNSFKTLYSHSVFLPETPYLGYNTNHNQLGNRHWYIWSYTPVQFISSKNEFMEGLFRHGYNTNYIMQKNVVDPLLEWDYRKSKSH